MVRLTRLNGKLFYVNADLIQFVEETPDTLVTLTNGEKIIVKEPCDEVVQKIIGYARAVRTLSQVMTS